MCISSRSAMSDADAACVLPEPEQPTAALHPEQPKRRLDAAPPTNVAGSLLRSGAWDVGGMRCLVLKKCVAVPAQAATPDPVKRGQVYFALILRSRFGMVCTDIAPGATSPSRTRLQHRRNPLLQVKSAIGLGALYAIPGTDTTHRGTRAHGQTAKRTGSPGTIPHCPTRCLCDVQY